MRTDKRKTLKRSNERSLKVQPKRRVNKHIEKDVPEIKLCDEWLRRHGFLPETRVVITSMPDLLIIRPAQ